MNNQDDPIFDKLSRIQKYIVERFNGVHVDIYYSEGHQGALVVQAGKPLILQNVIHVVKVRI